MSLDAEMIQLLAEMSVISEQRAHAYDAVQVHGGEKSHGLGPLSDKPMVDYWRDRYNGTTRITVRQTIVAEAREALDNARRMPTSRERPASMADPQWKRWVAESTATLATIAGWYSCSPQYVHEVRVKYRSVAGDTSDRIR